MISVEELKKYYPFNKIEEKFLPLLLEQFKAHDFVKGDDILKLDDNKVYAKYIISGAVEIKYPTGRTKVVKPTSMQSFYPIGDVDSQKKLASTVKSKTATVIMMNNIFLDRFGVWNNLYKETAADSPLRGHESYHWVVGLLNSTAVQMLPRGHVDEIFKNIEPVSVKAGVEIITEGEAGDCCYIISQGKVDVFKNVAAGQKQVATLGEGALFGEHALVSNEPRTATVRMQTDGVLMCMLGIKFSSLLKSHVVRWLTAEASYNMIVKGAVLLDVREDSELENISFQDSIHIPINNIRYECAEKLNKDQPIITCSNTGLRCASAAFLLATLGYDVYSMQGGVTGLLKLIERRQM